MKSKQLEHFIWRFGMNKRKMQSQRGKEQYARTRESLNKASKEDLIDFILALTSMNFQDRGTIETLLNEIEQQDKRMNIVTEKALSTMIIVYEMGQGVPSYLFRGHDIIDAIANGFVEEQNQALYLTDHGQTVVKELIELGEIQSYPIELSKNINKGTVH